MAEELPPLPPPSQPSKRDLAALPQSIHLGAPQPKAHMLQVSPHVPQLPCNCSLVTVQQLQVHLPYHSPLTMLLL